ncbi:unnamed protein product [Sphagnum balticum]
MVNDLAVVHGLSGEEIILDICAALAEKLRNDCNLREIDQYAGGYKASIPTIHIEAFGLDAAEANYSLEIENTTAGQDADDPIDLSLPDTVIDTELEIAKEEDLGLVRERSSQPTPDFEQKPALEFSEDGPVGQPKPRRYSRRLKALGLAQGGVATLAE